MADIVKYDKVHQSLARGLSTLVERVKKIDLKKEGVEFELTDLADKAKRARDIAKDRRDRELEPYEPKVREVKARWKDLVENFDLLYKRLKALGGDVIRRKREEEARQRREATRKLEAARKAEAEAKKKKAEPKAIVKTNIKEAEAALAELPPEGAPTGVKTETSTLHERKIWKWKVVDIDKVPKTYVQRLVDSKKVDMAVKNGKRKIAGIEIFEETIMVSRGKQ